MVSRRVLLLVLSGLVAVDLALAGIHLAFFRVLGKVPNLFNLDGEANIPSWWSSAQLLVASLLIAAVVLRTCRVDRRSWIVAPLAALLFLFSVDETACFHERLGNIVDAWMGGKAGTLVFSSGYWPFLIGIPVIVGIGVLIRLCLAFFADVPGAASRISLGLGVLMFGAVGVEAIDNVHDILTETLLTVVEETLEMIGDSILVWSALDLLRRHPATAAVWNGLSPLAPAARTSRSPKRKTGLAPAAVRNLAQRR